MSRTANKRKVMAESWDAAPKQPFVTVLKPTLKEPAWLDLSFGARCLLITVKSFFNGHNNGRIYLGVRKAAKELGSSRSSTERWFKELIDHGFLRVTQGAYLGAEGKASATYWRMTEVGCMGERPTCEYKQWKPDEPKKTAAGKNKTPHLKSGQSGPKIGTGRHENRDTRPQNDDGFAEIRGPDRPQNDVIDNIPWKEGVAEGAATRPPADNSGQATPATRRAAVGTVLSAALPSMPVDTLDNEPFPQKQAVRS